MTQRSNKQQHLFELLEEDQEPFFLKDYIADRRCQLKQTNDNDNNNNNNKSLDLHLKKRQTTTTKPKTNNITTTIITHQKPLCQKASCFYSSYSSPDLTKSPPFEFPSPISIKRSPCKRNPTTNTSSSSNPILLHVPARTAALLLEAALRIQKQPKPKAQRLGLFGSLLKRLTTAKKISQKLTTDDNRVDHDHVAGFDCPRPSSSGVWSESICNNSEDKSLDLESSSSSETASSSVDFVSKLDVRGFCDESSDEFCGQSPFRFVLQRSRSTSTSSSGRRTPDFSSPASSPARCLGKLEGKENYLAENSKGFQEEEEEEEKEQFSPVSVLDPPFEDDYDGHDDDDDDDQDQDSFDMESSFAIVQRTKKQLLEKLRQFERLAELDPIELEKRMVEQDDDEDSVEIEDQESEDYESINASDKEGNINHDGFVREVLSKSSYHRAPGHMKRLVSDLIVEERRERNSVLSNRDEELVKGVVKRFESWKDVQSNTIDMMVEQDFRNEIQGMWKSNNKEQIGETAVEIELSIFGLLIDELTQELIF